MAIASGVSFANAAICKGTILSGLDSIDLRALKILPKVEI